MTTTGLTGVLVLVSACAALIAGVLPLTPTADVRDLRLALTGGTVVCALLWALVSVRAPREDSFVLDKAGRCERPRSWTLKAVLGFAIPLTSAAALVRAVGPDSERGRWVSEVYAAGGLPGRVSVDRVLGSPRRTGNEFDDEYQFATDVTVILRFDGGFRSVTAHDATTIDIPAKGRTISVVYAPSRPGLGVRNVDNDINDLSGSPFALLWIWIVALFAGVFVAALFLLLPAPAAFDMDAVRRFGPEVHGPAALFLAAGVCLLLPGAYFPYLSVGELAVGPGSGHDALARADLGAQEKVTTRRVNQTGELPACRPPGPAARRSTGTSRSLHPYGRSRRPGPGRARLPPPCRGRPVRTGPEAYSRAARLRESSETVSGSSATLSTPVPRRAAAEHGPPGAPQVRARPAVPPPEPPPGLTRSIRLWKSP